MAIIEKALNAELVMRYSDLGMMIRQVETGDLYPEAVDLITAPWHYEETDIPVDQEEEPTEDEYAEAGRILLGESNE